MFKILKWIINLKYINAHELRILMIRSIIINIVRMYVYQISLCIDPIDMLLLFNHYFLLTHSIYLI